MAVAKKRKISPSFEVEAELALPIGVAQLVRVQAERPFEHAHFDAKVHRLDMSLASKTGDTHAAYKDRWGAHRFERVGSLFMIPAGEALTLRSPRGDASSLVVRLDMATMRKWLKYDIEWTERRLEASLDVTNSAIRALLRKLAHEMRHPGLASRQMTKLLAGQVAIEVGRHFSVIETSAAIGGLAPWRLKIVDERVSAGGKAPSVGELALLCSLSPRHLTRGFRVSRGHALGQYILQMRIDNAKRLLAGTGTITSIAEQLGFASLASFSFAFKRGAGVSPAQFRARALRKR